MHHTVPFLDSVYDFYRTRKLSIRFDLNGQLQSISGGVIWWIVSCLGLKGHKTRNKLSRRPLIDAMGLLSDFRQEILLV